MDTKNKEIFNKEYLKRRSEDGRENRLSNEEGRRFPEDKVSEKERVSSWRAGEDASKKHGDKVRSDGKKEANAETNSSGLADDERYESNTEFADPQDTNHDYLKQTQQLSDELGSVYAGKQSTAEERERLARERQEAGVQMRDETRKNLGQAGRNDLDSPAKPYGPSRQEKEGPEEYKRSTHDYGNPAAFDRTKYRDTGSKDHDDFRKNQGGIPPEDREPGYPSSRENTWDDEISNRRTYGESDFDDRKVRKNQAKGKEPWKSANRGFDEYEDDEYVKNPPNRNQKPSGSYEEEFERKYKKRPKGRDEEDLS